MVQNVAQKIHIAPDGNAATATTALTGWKGIFGYEFTPNFEATREQTQPITPGGLPRYTRIGARRGTVTFTTPLYCTAAAGTAGTSLAGTHSDPLLDLWYASGWAATLANTSTTYNLADLDAAHTRLAIIWQDGNRRMVLRRCLATPTITISARQELQVQWEVQGILETYDTTAALPGSLPAISEYTISPAQAKGMNLSVRQSIGGTAETAAEIYGLEINLGNTIELPEDLAAENGYGEPVFAMPREMGGSFKLPVPASGDSLGRKLQRNQGEGQITIKAFSDDSTSTHEISWEVDFAPVAVTEITEDIESILAESTNFMATEDLTTNNRRPIIRVLDSRLTG